MKIAIALVCLVLAAASAQAQGYDNPYTNPPIGAAPSCTPYPSLVTTALPLCGTPASETPPAPHGCVGNPGDVIPAAENAYDFPQVFIGKPGAENDYLTYVSLKNQAPTPIHNEVLISVTWEGSAAPVTRTFVLQPSARLSVQLNEWPELANISGGLTVEVRFQHKGSVGIAMHSARDFWGRFTILEGR